MLSKRLFKDFFFLAIVPTTGTFNNSDNLDKSILIPLLLASSRRLTQTIIFDVISLI